jgi:putative DNA primase/helicase
MNLREAIIGAGMTPPRHIPEGRFVRFPGAGKGGGNTAGWCRLITPTLAVFGDWSTGLTETWRDAEHIDTAESRRLLEQANQRERQYREAQRRRQNDVGREVERMIREAKRDTHPYLVAKGFPGTSGLVHEGRLLLPIRAVEDYKRVISAQLIDANGEKRFIPGGRVRGGVFRIGPAKPAHTLLCEGFATGQSLYCAAGRLPGATAVVVCFSANNLELVAQHFPGALVCADNDASVTGERSAQATGLPYVMPPTTGEDFNDLHQRAGLQRVIEVLRQTRSKAA